MTALLAVQAGQRRGIELRHRLRPGGSARGSLKRSAPPIHSRSSRRWSPREGRPSRLPNRRRRTARRGRAGRRDPVSLHASLPHYPEPDPRGRGRLLRKPMTMPIAPAHSHAMPSGRARRRRNPAVGTPVHLATFVVFTEGARPAASSAAEKGPPINVNEVPWSAEERISNFSESENSEKRLAAQNTPGDNFKKRLLFLPIPHNMAHMLGGLPPNKSPRCNNVSQAVA